jgi:hypothetical protein
MSQLTTLIFIYMAAGAVVYASGAAAFDATVVVGAATGRHVPAELFGLNVQWINGGDGLLVVSARWREDAMHPLPQNVHARAVVRGFLSLAGADPGGPSRTPIWL